jgi:hypothetical protein
MMKLNDKQRLALIREVYDKAYRELDSFENATGAFLLYLVGAIAGGDKCELYPAVTEGDIWPQSEDPERDDDVVVLQNVRAMFPAEHAVWQFIDVHEGE